MKKGLRRAAGYVGTGVVGAASVMATDGVVTRIGALNGHPIARAAARLGLAGGLALIARKLGVPKFAVAGLVAGPVLVTTLDAGVSMISRPAGAPALQPPPALGPGNAGDPWPPLPRHAVAARR
jgi:hypothetical protein